MGYPITYQVGRFLEKLQETGDQIPPQHQQQLGIGVSMQITPFHSQSPPNISTLSYFVTVSINAGLTDEQAIAVLVLIERLCSLAQQQGTPILINSLTVHRIILATVLLCSKFYNDVYYSNEQVGYVGGIHYQEMNLLEAYFLKVIEFRLFIDEVEFNQFSEQLQSYIADMNRIQNEWRQAQLQALAHQQQLQMQIQAQMIYQHQLEQQQQQHFLRLQQQTDHYMSPLENTKMIYSNQTSPCYNDGFLQDTQILQGHTSLSPTSRNAMAMGDAIMKDEVRSMQNSQKQQHKPVLSQTSTQSQSGAYSPFEISPKNAQETAQQIQQVLQPPASLFNIVENYFNFPRQ